MIEPTGPETCATVDTPAGAFTARVSGNLDARVGDRVHLAWDPAKVHLFGGRNGVRMG